jgi:ABC-type nitrate/sulfonate/bicarbonate transport system substrate-binding protein
VFVPGGIDANVTARTAGRSAASLLVLAALLAACGGQGATASPTASPSEPTTAGSAPAASPSEGAVSPTPAGPPTRVRLALDWTPNTNHIGFYVAQAKGWYRDAGIELDVLPYGTVAPEAVLAAHQAECGISFQDALTFAVAAGGKIVSVMAILQHTAQDIAVLASSGIERPRQLDGKVYAGFGYPNEVPTLKSVIQHDGGTGTFDVVTLDTAAYDALYTKRADFVITFAAWEGIQAQEQGIDLRTFAFTDYGFPDFYQVVLACDRDWLAKDPEAARAFVGATVKGFEFAAANPDEAAGILVAQNPGVFDDNPQLPKASAEYMAANRLLLDESGHAGTQTLPKWQGYSGFLYDQGTLVDKDGKPLTSPPDYAGLFTDDFLP